MTESFGPSAAQESADVLGGLIGERPLNGLKVLELARILAGPWVGQLLADLGADVVKVKRPGSADETRGWGPPFVEGADGGDLSAAYFHSCNRGKRSIAVDFETAEGRTLVRRLAAHADVVIENFKVGSLKKCGLDYDSLRSANSKYRPCPLLVEYVEAGWLGRKAKRGFYDYRSEKPVRTRQFVLTSARAA
jgi:crotonobetainyl-CoA:carnitine CoA-transferase CaiB-like acyl-CoA transferase